MCKPDSDNTSFDIDDFVVWVMGWEILLFLLPCIEKYKELVQEDYSKNCGCLFWSWLRFQYPGDFERALDLFHNHRESLGCSYPLDCYLPCCSYVPPEVIKENVPRVNKKRDREEVIEENVPRGNKKRKMEKVLEDIPEEEPQEVLEDIPQEDLDENQKEAREECLELFFQGKF